MPSAKKVRWAQLKVGLMALTALTIVGILIFLLTGEKALFARMATLYTYMDDSAALQEGSAVRLNGIVIGGVERVELSGSRDPNRIIRVTMGVRQEMLQSIPKDSIAAISAENVLGAKFINISTGRSAEHVKDGDEIPALDTRDFTEVVASSYALLQSLQGILKRVDVIVSQVEAGKGSIGRFLVDEQFYEQLTATVVEARKVVAGISSGQGTIGKLLYQDDLYADLKNSMQRLDQIITGIEQGEGTAGKFVKDPKLYDDARAAVGELRTLLADLNAGKGSAGKLLKDEQFYRQLNGTLAKIETTIDKINTGQGTLGQLMVNPSLYESLDGLTREMRGLIQDIRANPKKFLRIKLAIF